ncbi:MAG TPA: hypothetical protein VEW95_05440 [Candidatus Limnocylindrales bacterium]|nr:hypothetical protein [Candidatus Limnocylindrales bacterium]
MRRIFKFEMVPREDLIGVHPEIHVQMPRGAEILHVDAQGDRMFVWALVDPTAALARYSFVVLPTGAEVTWPVGLVPHIGTVLMRGGSLVWHVFSDREPRP